MSLKDFRTLDLDDDDAKPVKAGKVRLTEFECPGCNANNPTEPFGNKDELTCNYCGLTWEARIDEEGKLKLKEL